MQDYNNFNEEPEELEPEETHFFCKLTFGQFFTLIVLEILTLSFVFYLGARYGNEYLRLDAISEVKREPVSIVTTRDNKVDERLQDSDLRTMARKALDDDKVDLKQRVEEILARQQGPSTPPVGEPSYDETPAISDRNEGYAQQPVVNNQHALRDINQYSPSNIPSAGNPQGVVKVKSTENGMFAVQVGSYPDVKEASYRVEEWKVKGYAAYMMIANLGDKGQWYRVRIGAFANKDEANTYLDQLVAKEEINDAFVVKNEQ